MAQRLLADGEHVVDVPAKLAARARVLDTGHGRKTDAHDAHSVAVAAVRAKELRVLASDAGARGVTDAGRSARRADRGGSQTVNRVQRLLAELGARQGEEGHHRPSGQGDPRSVRPRDLAGKTRRRIAADELAELVAIEKKIKTLTNELKAMVLATGSNLMDLPGVGPDRRRPGAGRRRRRHPVRRPQQVRVLDRHRTPRSLLRRAVRHRLSRAGNRRMNHMIHIAATTQIRLDTEGRAYYRRKLAAGKTRMEAMRCLKRRISDAVYRQLIADAATGWGRLARAREGTAGRLKNPARSTCPRTSTLRISHFPDPRQPTLPPRPPPRKTTAKRPLKQAG